MKVSTQSFPIDSSTPKEIITELSKIKPVVRFHDGSKEKQKGGESSSLSRYYKKYIQYLPKKYEQV